MLELNYIVTVKTFSCKLEPVSGRKREIKRDVWRDGRGKDAVRKLSETGRHKKDKRAVTECVFYLMLSSRMRTRKRGRPCIFQHCLMNCRAFCTHRHTQTPFQIGKGMVLVQRFQLPLSLSINGIRAISVQLPQLSN